MATGRTSKVAKEFGIPVRTLRRYVAQERRRRCHEKEEVALVREHESLLQSRDLPFEPQWGANVWVSPGSFEDGGMCLRTDCGAEIECDGAILPVPLSRSCSMEEPMEAQQVAELQEMLFSDEEPPSWGGESAIVVGDIGIDGGAFPHLPLLTIGMDVDV